MTMRLVTRTTLLWAGVLLAGAASSLPFVAGHAEQAAVVGSPAEPPITDSRAVVRRLTETEYRASIADIFGPDVPITGRFERGLREEGLLSLGASHASVSAFSLEQYHISAQSIAATVIGDPKRQRIVPCAPPAGPAFDTACAKKFIENYGQLLFRRPLTREESTRYLKTAQAAQQRLGSFDKGLQFTLAGLLVAPEFLLRIEQTVPARGRPGERQLDAWSKASRLSFLLTEGPPDAELLRAAAAGELESEAGLARQADRLIGSPKFERKVRSFFKDMLALDEFADKTKDTDIFPAFNSKVAADAQEQTLRTIVDLLVAQKGDYRDIFTTRDTFLSRSLGIVYRLPVTPRYEFEKTQFPASTGRAGILSHVSLLALNAHPGISSPTLRGKFIRQTFLCQQVPDPPPNVDFSKFEGPKAVLATARERLTAHNESPACAGCHRLTDPMGLTLENFDGIGSFRTHENGKPINVKGSLDGVDFSGAAALGQALGSNPQTSQCLVTKVFHSGVGHSSEGQEPYLEYLAARFQQGGYRIGDLMRTIATSRGFYSVSAPKPIPTASRPQQGGPA